MRSITGSTLTVSITSADNTRCSTYSTLDISITQRCALVVGINNTITSTRLTVGITSNPSTQYITYSTLIIGITRDINRIGGPNGE